ncbi:MAG: hypothetical protein HY974_03290 [Candidatus Kerfeldbacteria bacterium]|nr:hypothetical protein [Candidatus Kerfeldbacteria bacterium]
MLRLEKIIKFGLYITAFLPLLFTPFSFFPWQFGKAMIFQILVEVLVFFWLYNCLSSPRKRGYSGQAKWFQKSNFLDWSILAFLYLSGHGLWQVWKIY